MEIQEGKYVNGSIDQSTVKWKSTPEDDSQTVSFNFTNRKLSLNEIVLPPNTLLTGVQFEYVFGIIFIKAEGRETNPSDNELTDKIINVSSNYSATK